MANNAGQNPLLTLEQMKMMLRNAEGRLKGRAPSPVHSIPLEESSRDTPPPSLPKLQHSLETEPYLTVRSGIAQILPSEAVDDGQRLLANQTKRVSDRSGAKGVTSKGPMASAGSDWFDLPRTHHTPELRRDLQMLRMRSTWDPKRHYKNDSRKVLVPDFSQVGTIVEGPTDFFSSRISKRNRKRLFVEEILAAEAETGRFKRKYEDLQFSKTRGRQAYYKKLQQKRFKTRL
ncbi:MAG: hypothetical protein Q9183_000902 [Haloplaca sp. 2 TL-2023]